MIHTGRMVALINLSLTVIVIIVVIVIVGCIHDGSKHGIIGYRIIGVGLAIVLPLEVTCILPLKLRALPHRLINIYSCLLLRPVSLMLSLPVIASCGIIALVVELIRHCLQISWSEIMIRLPILG